MLTVSTINVDRLGSHAGFLAWLRDPTSDVVCLQATGTEPGRRALQVAEESGWHAVVAAPSERGGNGAVVLSRVEPETSQIGFDAGEFDDSGRYAELALKDVVIGSVHLLPGPVDDAAEQERARFVQAFAVYLGELRARAEAGSKETLLCGSGNLVERVEEAAVGAERSAAHQRAALAAADTQRHQRVLIFPSIQFFKGRQPQSIARHTHRMSQSDRSAVNIQSIVFQFSDRLVSAEFFFRVVI